jgi:hypothetical protein
MKSKPVTRLFAEQRWIKPVYLMLLLIMGISGFAQMPIFKRYYIADIPGLGWLAQFYVTHIIHYVGAILLIVLTTYITAVYLKLMRKRLALTKSATIRIAILAAVMITGIFRVLKNLPDVVFSPGFTMFIDISHLGFMMALMVCGLIAIVARCRWLKENPTPSMAR